jgi:hypothetical protein
MVGDHRAGVERADAINIRIPIFGYHVARRRPVERGPRACYTRSMADNGSGTPAIDAPMGPGIEWEPGEEDYPFPARAGESALEYLRRWVESATYGRIEHAGARFIHERRRQPVQLRDR